MENGGWLVRALIALLGVPTVVAGCTADAARTGGWGGSIDTMANGAVVTRSPRTGAWDSVSAWRLVEELRLGAVEGDGADVFGRVQAADLDALDRIWVLDRQAVEIRVFARSGAFVRSVGREGAGPGEFRRPIALVRGPAGRMWVVDPGNVRYSVFDTSGAYVAGHRRPMNSSTVPWPGGIDDRGRIYDYDFAMRPGSFSRRLLRFRPGRDAAGSGDTIPIPEPSFEEAVFEVEVQGGMARAPVPFSATFAWSFDPRGFILFASTGEYRIHRVTLDGDTLRTIEREHERLPVTAEERRTAIEGLRWLTDQGGRIDVSRIPDSKPQIVEFFADEADYVWVRPTPAGPSDDERPGLRLVYWDIFDPDGRYLGRLDGLPARLVVRGNTVIGSTTDELGVAYVIRYRIEGR